MSKELTETVKELRLLGWSEKGANDYTDLIMNNKLNLFSSSQYGLLLTLTLLFLIFVISISTIVHLNKKKKPPVTEKNTNNLQPKYNLSDEKLLPNEKKSILKRISSVEKQLTAVPIVNRDKIKKLVKAIVPLKENREIAPKTIKNVSLRNLNSNLRKLISETSIDLDKTAEIFILAFIVIYDLSIKVIKFFTKSLLRELATNINKSSNIMPNPKLNKVNNIEVRGNISGEQLLNSLSRDQLIKLIAATPSTLKKLNFKEREEELMKKTNLELKSLLKGEVNISRLKKKELVSKILSMEKDNLIGSNLKKST